MWCNSQQKKKKFYKKIMINLSCKQKNICFTFLVIKMIKKKTYKFFKTT